MALVRGRKDADAGDAAEPHRSRGARHHLVVLLTRKPKASDILETVPSKELDQLIQTAIADGTFPGACFAYAKPPNSAIVRTAGRYTYCPESPKVEADTIWDLASVSKVVGMT